MAQALKTLSNVCYRLQAIRIRNFCSHKDLTQVPLQASSDLLLQNLKNATSTSNVLEMVAKHGKIMNSKHIIQALRTLFTLQKHGNSGLSTKDIILDNNFAKLCKILKNQAGKIEINDTIEALKVVTYVGVQSNSTIVEVLLRLVKHNINQLSLHQVIFLDFLLSQYKETPIIEALKIALPLVFQIHLPMKMDRDSCEHLAEYLQYASSKQLDEGTVQNIVDVLLKYRGRFDVKTAKSIVWSICDLPHNESLPVLLEDCLDILGANINELTFADMELILLKLINRHSKKYTYFFNEIFYSTCANYVIDHNMPLKESIYILKKFGKISYVNNSLLDYISNMAFEQPDFIRNADPSEIYHIVVSVGMTDYRPVHWDNLKKLIMDKENLAGSDKKEIKWLKFGEALCLTEIYRVDVLSCCLEMKFLDYIMERSYVKNLLRYITIWQSINLHKPDLKCLLSTKYTPKIFIENIYKDYNNYPLEGALHKVLGGEAYVKTGLYSEYGAFIDHVIVFRKGGYPVADHQNVKFIEEMKIPPHNQLVLIVALKSQDYTLNKKLYSSAALCIKFLESKGYTVVPICVESWENLADFEKIPYLMQKIKEKTDIDQSVQDFI